MWKTTSTRSVYENPWIRVREDEVVRTDGKPGIYGVVEVRSPAVFIVPVTASGEVILVTVDRYTTGRATPEVPAGASDGEEPLVAARRELREETGLAAATWRPVGTVDCLNGVAASPGQVFLASDLTEVGGSETEVEGITEAHPGALGRSGRHDRTRRGHRQRNSRRPHAGRRCSGPDPGLTGTTS